ncbi:MAG: NAD-dependent malic enzyme [Bryobacterales bacterium]
MPQIVIPLRVPPKPKRRLNRPGRHETKARGMAVLTTPLLNKGTAFSGEERKALGLTGLLPAIVSTLMDQAKYAYFQYQRLLDPLSKNVFLTTLHDRNEVLFYRLLSDHLREMIPIVNDLTVGMAMEQYRHEFRRPRGVYLSIDHPEAIETAFENLHAGPNEIDLIVATDAERVLGIGDWGVGGIEISIGKLAIFTAAGGIDPLRAIPVMLDVGTNRESLLQDPMYIGNRHARVNGERYDAFIDAYVTAVRKLFPKAVLNWADFAPDSGRHILDKYSDQFPTFNDDLQGTGAITLAAAISASRICGAPLRNQRVVIFGAGTAGISIADQLRAAMVREGLSREEATGRFWLVDRPGLLTDDLDGALDAFQANYVRPAAEVKGWSRNADAIGLAEVVHAVRPTMLIGASTVSGAFTQAIVQEMAAHTERPIIFPLSSPASIAEATPADLIAWTDGRALIATGSPFGPVTHKGITYVIGQVNNATLYPGLGLGAIVSQARRISSGMFAAAANAVSSLVAVRLPGASLLPQFDNLRSVSMTVALAVAETALEEGLAGVELVDIVRQVQDAMWQPEYCRLRAS